MTMGAPKFSIFLQSSHEIEVCKFAILKLFSSSILLKIIDLAGNIWRKYRYFRLNDHLSRRLFLSMTSRTQSMFRLRGNRPTGFVGWLDSWRGEGSPVHRLSGRRPQYVDRI